MMPAPIPVEYIMASQDKVEYSGGLEPRFIFPKGEMAIINK